MFFFGRGLGISNDHTVGSRRIVVFWGGVKRRLVGALLVVDAGRHVDDERCRLLNVQSLHNTLLLSEEWK